MSAMARTIFFIARNKPNYIVFSLSLSSLMKPTDGLRTLDASIGTLSSVSMNATPSLLRVKGTLARGTGNALMFTIVTTVIHRVFEKIALRGIIRREKLDRGGAHWVTTTKSVYHKSDLSRSHDNPFHFFVGR